MSVTLGIYGATDATGWTTFVQDGGGTTFYVSNSGLDSNNGLTSGSPVQTIAHALTLLTSGHDDWLLLKKGDVWAEVFNVVNLSGKDASHPMLFSSYGTGARPQLKLSLSNTPGLGSNGAFPTGGDFLAVVGIDFYASTRDPSSGDFNGPDSNAGISGIVMLNSFNWLLFED